MDKNELMALDPKLAALMAESEIKPEEQRKNFEDEDRKIPRIKVLQGLSELVANGDGKQGQIAMTINGHIYADPGEPITVIPLFYWKSRIMFEGVGGDASVICQANDGKIGVGDPGGDCYECPMAKWTEDGDERIRPRCNASHNFFVCIPNESDPNRFGIIDFTKTSYSVGTKFLNRVVGNQGLFWGYGYKLGSKKESSGKTTWWTWDQQKWDDGRFELPINEITDDFVGLFKECESVYKAFKDVFTKPSDKNALQAPKNIEPDDNEVPF